MPILEFMPHFPSESNCENYIKESREKAGICCKTCNSITNTTGLAEVNSLNAAFVGGEVL